MGFHYILNPPRKYGSAEIFQVVKCFLIFHYFSVLGVQFVNGPSPLTSTFYVMICLFAKFMTF